MQLHINVEVQTITVVYHAKKPVQVNLGDNQSEINQNLITFSWKGKQKHMVMPIQTYQDGSYGRFLLEIKTYADRPTKNT